MKRFFALIFVFIFALLLVHGAYAEQADSRIYGLDDVLMLAAERAERIRLSEEDIHLSEAARDRAIAALMPKLSLFGEGRRYSESEKSGSQVVQPETMTLWGARFEQSISLGG